jgi:hypothetical protein
LVSSGKAAGASAAGAPPATDGMMLTVSPALICRPDRRVRLREISNVFVVDVDVDEAAQLAFGVVQVRLEARVPVDQIGQQLADRLAVHFDRVLPVGERPQRGRNQNLSRH